jgi:hypothetical protein
MGEGCGEFLRVAGEEDVNGRILTLYARIVPGSGCVD